MRQILKIVFISVLFFVYFCQNLTAQNFFPLQIENRYQYEKYYISSNSNPNTTFPKIFVTESLIVDQDTFYNFNGRYYRFDMQSQKLFTYLPVQDTILLSVDFTLPQDSSMIMRFDGEEANFTSHGQYPGEVFGETKTIFKITAEEISFPPCGQQIDRWRFEFAEDIGMIFSRRSHNLLCLPEYWYTYTRTIYAAIIDSIHYNQHLLDIQILTELSDRPINNFPFMLQVGLSITEFSFLDSLYAEVQVIRNDSILVSQNNYIISRSLFRANIDLDSTTIMIGDKIKIRAIATDNTIFENYSSDPDSGFYEFMVLPASTSVISTESLIKKFALNQNYPNPFNPVTTITYQIPERGIVTLKVYDVLGNEVTTLVNEESTTGGAGIYDVEFNATGLPTGIYFYQLRAGEFIETKKMILLK